ncbi:hypothetical protein TeGR_g14921, partial [Tetraparma gracilis]
MQGMFHQATAFDQDLSPWCVALVSSESFGFGNEGADPIWGTSDGNCPTACSTGADGNECQNGGTATGSIPFGSEVTSDSVADNCSCTCADNTSGVNCETKTACTVNADGNACASDGVVSGFIVDGDCACDCTIYYKGDTCTDLVTCEETMASLCENGAPVTGVNLIDA